MRLLNRGSDSFDDDAGELLNGLQQRRSELIGEIVDVHLGIGLLTGMEAERLAQKQGADPRVPILRAHAEASLARVDALSVERDIATVRTPSPPAGGAVVHGRLTDVAQHAAGRITVVLVGDKQQPVAEPVESDEAGYYAFVLKPETVTAIGGTKLTIMLRDGTTQVVPAAAAAKPFTIAAGATAQQDVALSTAELEKLRLRAPIVDRPVPAQPQTLEEPPVPEKPPVAARAPVDKPSVSAPPATSDQPPVAETPPVGEASAPAAPDKPATAAPAAKAAPPAKRAPEKPPAPKERSRGGKPGRTGAAKRGGGRKKR